MNPHVRMVSWSVCHKKAGKFHFHLGILIEVRIFEPSIGLHHPHDEPGLLNFNVLSASLECPRKCAIKVRIYKFEVPVSNIFAINCRLRILSVRPYFAISAYMRKVRGNPSSTSSILHSSSLLLVA